MTSMNNLIQTLNDKHLDLVLLLKDFNKVLSNTVETPTVCEDVTGRCYTNIRVIDEDGVHELEKIYDKLERIIGE